MIITVIFDLDDTLYDEVEYCKSGFAAVARFVANLPEVACLKKPAEDIFDAFWRQFTTGNRTKTFNRALDELGIEYGNELISELIKTYRNHTPKITLPQESRDVLSQLSSKYTLALLTDGFLPAQQLKVQVLGIERYFKCIIYTEQLGRDCWKPSPIGFEKLLKSLNSKPQTAAYIADDASKDFIAPNKLGILSIQIIRPAGLHTSIAAGPQAGAQYIIHKLSDLPVLLEKL